MKSSWKAAIITTAVVVGLLIVALIFVLNNQGRSAPPADGAGETPQVVRVNSHVLDEGDKGAVTVVEFLDFECEACGAFYPIVEDLRKQFAGEITYVVRYFPLPGHFNSKNAAIAAEAAAGQDRFEEMYRKLFETQSEWGEAQESRADLFRSFAEELGLDLAAYDAAVADPATAERVESDVNDGRALGVTSTPTFFIDGKAVELKEWDDLENAIAAAVNGGS
ncbi:DsbA family protein [Microbacterium trichothecenolyticum]